MSLFRLYVFLVFHFLSCACCLPVNSLLVPNASSLSQDPDLSPMIYHVPNTHNTLYILPYNYLLPTDEFQSSIHGARIYIAHRIAAAEGKANVPLPPDQDPFVYGPDLTVKISWQSFQGSKLTWGILAAAMRGLEDCLVKNDHLPFKAVWHVFDGAQEGEVGWGMIGGGRVRGVERGAVT